MIDRVKPDSNILKGVRVKQFSLKTLFAATGSIAVVLAVIVPWRFPGLLVLLMFAPLLVLHRPLLLRIWIAAAATLGANLAAFGFVSYLMGYGLDPYYWLNQTVPEVCGNGFGLLVESIAGYLLFVYKPPPWIDKS